MFAAVGQIWANAGRLRPQVDTKRATSGRFMSHLVEIVRAALINYSEGLGTHPRSLHSFFARNVSEPLCQSRIGPGLAKRSPDSRGAASHRLPVPDCSTKSCLRPTPKKQNQGPCSKPSKAQSVWSEATPTKEQKATGARAAGRKLVREKSALPDGATSRGDTQRPPHCRN